MVSLADIIRVAFTAEFRMVYCRIAEEASMKRIVLITTSVLCALHFIPLYAQTKGAYVGLGLGDGSLGTPNHYAFTSTLSGSHTQEGFSGRVFGGVNINPCLGLEIGYSIYAQSQYRGTTTTSSSTITYNAHTYDAVAKAYLPIGRSGFQLYGILGAARVAETVNYQNGGVPLNGTIATPNNGTSHSYKTRPLYGIGTGYEFGPHITMRGEYTLISRLGDFKNSATAIPFMNLITANLVYHFG